MKKTTTRHSFFETNSSSVHSIIISDGNDLSGKIPIRDDMVTIYPQEFGWGVEVFRDAITKASYCLTYCMNYITEDQKKVYLERFKNVIKNQLKVDKVKFGEYDDEYYHYGFIDHQSIDTCSVAFEDDVKLRNFIFNPNSRLIIDNDNH